jgi:hypothetical protein
MPGSLLVRAAAVQLLGERGADRTGGEDLGVERFRQSLAAGLRRAISAGSKRSPGAKVQEADLAEARERLTEAVQLDPELAQAGLEDGGAAEPIV